MKVLDNLHSKDYGYFTSTTTCIGDWP